MCSTARSCSGHARRGYRRLRRRGPAGWLHGLPSLSVRMPTWRTLHPAEWARRTFVGVGLYWCLASYWARVTGTTTIGLGRTVGGGHGVDRFKVAMGATVLDSPARAGIQPLAAAYLTMRRPDSEVLAMTGKASGT